MICKKCYHYDICKVIFEGLGRYEASCEIRKSPDFKCSEFKDKSLVIEMPCHFGEELFVVGSMCLSGCFEHLCNQRIKRLGSENCCDDCSFLKETIVFKRVLDIFLLCSLLDAENYDFVLGKTVFKTQEEAEQALKEM